MNAEKSDAPLIGEVVVAAIGDELAHSFAGEKTVEDVKRLFTKLAAREDSQYSYRNSLKAVDENGEPMGFAVGYDGALLHQLRKAFFEEVRLVLEREMDGKVDDECEAGEFYLDSLAVFPAYRGKGVARALIQAMAQRGLKSGKPLGLLCDKTNATARRLYDALGFRQVGEAPFAGEVMDHLQIRG
ncbi:MAG: GNAT family N-acetyltransferase [Ruminococcus flavefaciens]|nr:GNAT family N-acetyltransferase [Ruminococcus flavefaciens]